MRTRHTEEAVLNLEQQKKQARELLRAIRAGSAEALARCEAGIYGGPMLMIERFGKMWPCMTLSLSSRGSKGLPVGRSSNLMLKLRPALATRGSLSPMSSGSQTGYRAFCAPGTQQVQRPWNRFANGIRGSVAARMKKFFRPRLPKQMPNWSMHESMGSIPGMILSSV